MNSGGIREFALTRRALLQGLGGGLAGAGILAMTGFPAVASAGSRKLFFRSLHTGDEVAATYWSNGKYQKRALQDINHVLRDWRNGEIAPIDLKLLDQLYLLRAKLGRDPVFEVVSGYRSPSTNALLASKSNGVAKKSLHMSGRAVDIAVPGHKLRDLRDLALSLKAGGVGYYPKSGFVHLDSGRPRHWGW